LVDIEIYDSKNVEIHIYKGQYDDILINYRHNVLTQIYE
jgi:hypothetical protein